MRRRREQMLNEFYVARLYELVERYKREFVGWFGSDLAKCDDARLNFEV